MRHFRYKTLLELQQEAERIGADSVCFENQPQQVRAALAKPVPVGDRVVGNSIAIHPMEGCDGTLDGRPGELTYRRYDRFARGGAKLVWFEATAVNQEGRANTRQLWLNDATRDDFARILEQIHRAHSGDGLLVPMQLTHSGRYSVPRRILADHNPQVDAKFGTADLPLITDDELERVEDDYVRTAGLALQAGFDSVDVKMTHGYLLSELLGAKTRLGRYGGSLENRLRFPLNVIGKLRAAFGKRLLIGARMGCFDGVPYQKGADGVGVPIAFETPYAHGFGVRADSPLEEDLAEVFTAVRLMQQAGLQFLNVSIGCPYYNPHVTRPFEKPDEGNYEEPEHPLLGVDRHFRIARALQNAFPDLPMIGSGYSWLQKYALHAGAANLLRGNIRFVGLGRGALAYPDFARDILETGELQELRVCKTLTFCTYLMRQKHHPLGQFPTGCPPFDKEVYGEVIKLARKPH
jgi:NADPH2 dehydrogenase